LGGERLLLRPAHADDAAAIADILAEPEVARWWGRSDLDGVRRELRDLRSFVLVVEGAVAGWLHVHEEADPDYQSVALDIAVTTTLRGLGYGQEALRVAVRHFAGRGHHRFTIDPAVDNERAIRSYGRIGFKPVGVRRAYERAPDGTRRDGLLMDLLAGELEG
jgi:aminoglycoside 6'-N-acetyltransferase